MQLDVNQYPHIDLNKMFEIPGCAVRVPTEYDAETIIANFIRQYPDNREFQLRDTYWDNHREDTAYTIWDTFDGEDMSPRISTIGYADAPWFMENGYTIIEFDELAQIPDLEEGDLPLEFLMG